MKKLFMTIAVVTAAMMMSCSQQKAQQDSAAEPAEELAFIRMNCYVTVDEENRDALVEVAKQLVAASQNDEGVIDYDIMQSETRPNKLMIYETWADQASLDKHMASAHFTTLVPKIQELGSLEIKQLNQPKEAQRDADKPFRMNVMLTVSQKDSIMPMVPTLVEGSIKNDAGCLDYDYFQSLTKPDQMLLLEVWENQASLDAHCQSPHYLSTFPKMREFFTLKADRLPE